MLMANRSYPNNPKTHLLHVHEQFETFVLTIVTCKYHLKACFIYHQNRSREPTITYPTLQYNIACTLYNQKGLLTYKACSEINWIHQLLGGRRPISALLTS